MAITLLDGVLVTGAGASVQVTASKRVFVARVVGTGAVTADVDIEVSLDGTYWLLAATIALDDTTSDVDGVALDAPWPFVRGNVTAVTGTGAAVTLWMGA